MHFDNILLGIILLTIVWAYIEQKLIVTSKYIIKPKRLPDKLNGTSFVVLADLHNRTFGKNNERLIKRIDALKPDYILVAGDMVNKKSASYPSSAYQLLEQLAKRYKIYYAYGNHEQRLDGKSDKELTFSKEQERLSSTWVEYRNRLSKLKVTFLSNEHITFEKNDVKLTITGVSIGPKYFERNKIPEMEHNYLRQLIGSRNKEVFQILIAHNPVFFHNYVKWGADLVISGHLHGGMVRLPGVGGVISPQAKFFPKYHAGVYQENDQYMVVSRGLGSHSIMPRLFNIPELVYIELNNK